MRSSALRLLGQQAVRRVGASSSQAAPALLLRSTAWQPSPAGALFALGGSGGACGRPGMLIPRFLCSSSDDSGGDGDDKAAKKRFGKKKPPPAAAAEVDMDADPDAEVVSSDAEAEPEYLESPPEGALPVDEGSADREGDGLVRFGPDNISTMPPVLVFPFSNRPLFPGVYQPCEVTHEALSAALVAVKASSHPYVAVFLPKADEATGEQPELANVTDPSQIHEVGTLAQITRLSQTPKGVQVLLLGGKRITLGRVLQSEPVMLAKVVEAEDEARRGRRPLPRQAYSMEVCRRSRRSSTRSSRSRCR